MFSYLEGLVGGNKFFQDVIIVLMLGKLMLYIQKLSVTVEWVAPLLQVWEVLYSDLGPEANCFSQILSNSLITNHPAIQH
jgi:hypothetical protein